MSSFNNKFYEDIEENPKFGDPDDEVNILHISDLHYGIGNEDEKEIFNMMRTKMIRSLVRELNKYESGLGAWKPDIVVVSGDIANTGDDKEYQAFKSDFYDFVKNGWELDDDCIIICPGNHDVMLENVNKNKIPRPSKSKKGMSPGDELKPLDRINTKELTSSSTGDNIDEPLMSYFHDYIINCCDGKCQNIVRLQSPTKWPWVKFLILNSAWDCRGRNDEDRLRVGAHFVQKYLLSAGEEDDSIYCAVFHHPLLPVEIDNGKGKKIVKNWLALSEQNSVVEGRGCFVEQVRNVKCIFNGHIHTSLSPRFIGTEDHMGFWSVCGTLFSKDTAEFHCRVVKIRKNGFVYYADLDKTFEENCESTPWRISTRPGNKADKKQFEKEQQQDEIINIITELVPQLDFTHMRKLAHMIFAMATYDNPYLWNFVKTNNLIRHNADLTKKLKKEGY